jgi:hypothetical protein
MPLGSTIEELVNVTDDETRLLGFIEGTGTDHRGRTLDDVLALDDDDLEHTHDYIQWLFPLPERSPYNPVAPILTSASVLRFRRDQALRARVVRATHRMLSFFGFELSRDNGLYRVTPTAMVERRAADWLTLQNHNYLRLTRILRCLMLIGEPEIARACHDALERLFETHGDVIGERTRRFWREAVSSELPERKTDSG